MECQRLNTYNINDLPTADHMRVDQLTLSLRVDQLTLSLKTVAGLPFENLELPPYQRPYKWTVENVMQLLSDLCAFSDRGSYRLGTIVLHANQIVDGQQRLVTLALLLQVIKTRGIKLEEELDKHLCIFNQRIAFNDPESIAHVRENLEAIRERQEDFDAEFALFVQNRCSFVVVQVPDLAAAFQFFDSQNARGKPLEPHDLLKAYHLRAIKHLSDRDSENIDAWQAQDTKELRQLFLSLYRVKRWMAGRPARRFTKDDIGIFKGINLEGNSYPCYQPDVMCDAYLRECQNSKTTPDDKKQFEYPFQLSHPCINGSRFFDMIRHYSKLYADIRKSGTFIPESRATDSSNSAAEIINSLNTYSTKHRTGDKYIRELFDCILLFYIDKFGDACIDRAVRKIFCEAYSRRLSNHSVLLATMDNAALGSELIKVIRDAVKPADVLNYRPPRLNKYAGNADTVLKDLYTGILK